MEAIHNKKNIIRKTLKGCLIAFLIFFVIALGLVGYYVYAVFIKETPVLTDTSADHTAKIKIVQKGEPAFFGPTSIKVYYMKDNGYQKSQSGTLYNDGGPAIPSNFSIYWEDRNNVTISLINTEGASSKVIKFTSY